MDNIANTVKKWKIFECDYFPRICDCYKTHKLIFVNIFTQHDNIIVQLEKLKFYKQ